MEDSHNAEQLLIQGVEFKKAGEYGKALDMYAKSLDYNPFDPMAYYNMGKISYLLGKDNLSILSYLAYIHLNLHLRELKLRGMAEYPPMEKMINDMNYESLSSQVKLPTESSIFIFQSPNGARHIAHSVIDFSGSYPQYKKYAQAYRADIEGKGRLDSVLRQNNLSMDEYNDAEDKIYRSGGIEILFNNIKWKQIMDTNVIGLYFR